MRRTICALAILLLVGGCTKKVMDHTAEWTTDKVVPSAGAELRVVVDAGTGCEYLTYEDKAITPRMRGRPGSGAVQVCRGRP